MKRNCFQITIDKKLSEKGELIQINKNISDVTFFNNKVYKKYKVDAA